MPRKKKVTEDPSSRSSLHSSLMVINKEKPQQRNAANARERARMRVLSRAFYRLKTALTWVPADTKLSKLDTLRMAAKHISFLKGLLDDDSPYNPAELRHPAMSLTWPFGFNKSCTTGSGPGDVGGGESEDGEDECGGLVDDGESLSCVSGSSWDEVKTVTQEPTKDRSHLDTSSTNTNETNNNSTLNPFNNPNFQQQHPHAHLPTFHQNILSFS